MTDIYEFEKSCLPQGVSMESPYVSKQWGYINDINSSVYSNNGLTLVQFDLSSIYNSTQMIDVSQLYITIPVTYVTAWVNGVANALLVPPAGAWASTGLKNGYWNLIHGADLQINGKTVEQFQPNLNAYVGFKMLSQMSQDDLKSYGASLGMGDYIDNWESLKFQGNASAGAFTGNFPDYTLVANNVAGNASCIGGNGISNNTPFPLAGNADFGDQGAMGPEFTGAYNNGYYSRLKKFPDVSSTTSTYQSLYSSTGTATTCITAFSQLRNEFKPYFTIQNTNYAVWYDVAVIRLGDIFDSFKSLPLMKKFDGILRLYVNTGSVVSNTMGAAGGGSTTGQMVTSGSAITFTNTCPLMQSALLTLTANTTAVASALFVANPTNTAISAGGVNVNFANAGAAHFMTACRCYYPQVTLKVSHLDSYISQNRAKRICFTSILTNTFSNIGAGTTVSYLVQSGVTNIRGVLIMPFISSNASASYPHGALTATNATGVITPFAQMLSPFDTAPLTNAPISLINLQVAIGGVNVLQNTYNYSYENFLQSVSLYEKVNAGDLGLSCGLINQNYWENAFRVYYVDCTRCNIADMMTPRNINVTFTNNSLQTIDCLIFTEYFKEITVDCETGLIET